jgi:hypothetical protein
MQMIPKENFIFYASSRLHVKSLKEMEKCFYFLCGVVVESKL